MNLKQAIALHKSQCEKDAVYFATNFCYIQHPIKKKIKFDLFDVQKEALADLQKYKYNIALKSRQMGFSTLVAAYVLWMMTFHSDSNILVIATKLGVAKNMITKIKEMYRSLPIWLQEDTEELNKTSIRFKNGSQVKAVGATEDSGRSEALSLLIVDECAFVPYIDEIWTSAFSTLSTGGKAVLLSTPNGIGNFFHQMWTSAIEGPSRKEKIVPAPNISSGRKYVRYVGTGVNEFHPIFMHWSTHPERDDVWRETQENVLGHDRALQEVEGDFLVSGNTVVHGTIIQSLEQETSDPIEKRYQEQLWIWKYYNPDREYIITCDVARGDGSDFSTFHVWDTLNNEQVAEFRGKIPTEDLARMLCNIGQEYGDAIISVENANIGWAVLQKIIYLEYPNLYYSNPSDPDIIDLSKNIFSNKVNKEEKNLIPGFTTSRKTRPVMVDKIIEYTSNHRTSMKINSTRLVQEFWTWVWKSKGGTTSRADHLSGYHDDLILALGQYLWLIDINLKLKALKTNIIKSKLNSSINVAKKQKGVYNSKKITKIREKQTWQSQTVGNEIIDLRDLI